MSNIDFPLVWVYSVVRKDFLTSCRKIAEPSFSALRRSSQHKERNASMKKMLILAILLAVVGTAYAGQQKTLSVGSRVAEYADLAIVAIYNGDGTDMVQDSVRYNPDQGSIEYVVNSVIENLLVDFEPKIGTPYRVFIQVSSKETNGLPLIAYDRAVSLEKAGEKWIISGVPNRFEYQPYIEYSGAGVTGVTYSVDGWGEIPPTRNGVYDETCNLYSYTNGVLYLPAMFVTGGVTGTITLDYADGYEKFNLATGDLVESTRKVAEDPIPPAFLVSIRPGIAGSVEIVVSGSAGNSVTVESSGDFIAWTPVQKVSLTSYPTVVVEKTNGSHRFFRARLDASPQ